MNSSVLAVVFHTGGNSLTAVRLVQLLNNQLAVNQVYKPTLVIPIYGVVLVTPRI